MRRMAKTFIRLRMGNKHVFTEVCTKSPGSLYPGQQVSRWDRIPKELPKPNAHANVEATILWKTVILNRKQSCQSPSYEVISVDNPFTSRIFGADLRTMLGFHSLISGQIIAIILILIYVSDRMSGRIPETRGLIIHCPILGLSKIRVQFL